MHPVTSLSHMRLLWSRLTRPGLAVVAAGLIAGCASPSGSGGEPPAESDPASVSDTAPAPVAFDPLPSHIAACAPPERGTPWTETGRTHSPDNVEYVLIEPVGAARTTEFDPVVLRMGEAACVASRVEPMYGGVLDGGFDTLDYQTWSSLRDQSFAWHVGKVGSARAFADLYRAEMGPNLTDCPSGQDTGTCLQTWRAQQFRDRGIEVARSEPVEE